ncbi:hypothetical protein IX296_000039 [Bacteroides pyogenes]|nr:hypothetical protein [Bacteroides pyogenes]MBR8752817.1 hypothetical protein [Bacteroides pyogenes]MBR8794127.1 hypothetical protein [Bacteroides pyogenes]MBR8807782.1 hypothetical protein [Bacteroides pyogenes]
MMQSCEAKLKRFWNFCLFCFRHKVFNYFYCILCRIAFHLLPSSSLLFSVILFSAAAVPSVNLFSFLLAFVLRRLNSGLLLKNCIDANCFYLADWLNSGLLLANCHRGGYGKGSYRLKVSFLLGGFNGFIAL